MSAAADVLAPSSTVNKQPRAVEDIYQKKTQLEHILLRPDTYVGSIEHQQQSLWVHDGEKMVNRQVSFVPGLYKIFDEILVNAADNKVRDSSMSMVKVDVDEVCLTLWHSVQLGCELVHQLQTYSRSMLGRWLC